LQGATAGGFRGDRPPPDGSHHGRGSRPPGKKSDQ
jgi:hypothetical protein